MSLAQINEKIMSDANKQAEEILSRAKAEAALISKKADEEHDLLTSDLSRRFERERPEIFRRREIVADLDVKKMMLQAQRDLISDVYADALQKMKNMEQGKYTAFCETLMESAVVSKDEEMQVAPDEKYLTGEWLEGYNSRHGTSIKMSAEHADIAGGFILSRGRISTDCSWDMLIQVAKEKQESDVVKRLFPSAV